MSSRKLSDKEFDRYTRNILKKPEDIAFDESAWAAMEHRMAQEAASSSVSGLKWLIPAIILFISSLGYLGYQGVFRAEENASTPIVANIDPIVDESTQVNTINPSESTNDLTNESASIATTSESNTQETNDVISTEEKQSSITTENSTSSLVSIQEKTSPTTNNQTSEPTENNTSGGNTSADISNDNSSIVTNESSTETLENIVEETNSQEAGFTPTEQIENTTIPARPKPSNIAESDLDTTYPASTPKTQEEEEEEVIYSDDLLNPYPLNSKRPIIHLANLEDPKLILIPQKRDHSEQTQIVGEEEEDDKAELPTPFNRWSVGVTLAPDFTTVGQLSEFTKPGIDFGITAEYFILRRLSITTGAILTRKLYNTTDLSEYTIPAGFWNGNDGPDEIAANCKVIDIPLNIRYRLREGKRTSLFVSAGISSYLMLTERYDYDYGYGAVGNGNQPQVWEVANENNHFFGVYNLSMGINRRVTDKISIEAEPFLKNSLGGVGWGQVRLKSTGVLFHVKYNF